MNFLCSLQRRKVTEFRARENVRTNHRQSHQIRTGGIILSCEKSVEFLVEYGMLICSPRSRDTFVFAPSLGMGRLYIFWIKLDDGKQLCHY